MFEIFYVWGYENRGAFINDPIDLGSAPEEELGDLAFYSSMAADLAAESAVADQVALDLANLMGE